MVSLTCVIVDDSADFLGSAACLLEAEGMRVVGRCRTGDEARSAINATSPNVILVDVELGDEDGVQVAAELAEQDRAAVVILISSRGHDELQETLDRSPGYVFRYLAKNSLSAAAIADLM